jgi:hypothetical protein
MSSPVTSPRSLWIVGAALAAGAAAALVATLGYMPESDRAALAKESIERVQSENDVLQMELTALQADAVNLPTYQAELASLRGQFPTSLELSNFTRYLQGLADAAGLVVESIQVGAAIPVDFLPEFPDGPGGVQGPALPDPVPGLYMYPISLTIGGSLESARAYLDALQGESAQTRMFLAPSVTWSQEEPEPGSDEPSERFDINGMTFALVPYDQIPQPEGEEAAESSDDSTEVTE